MGEDYVQKVGCTSGVICFGRWDLFRFMYLGAEYGSIMDAPVVSGPSIEMSADADLRNADWLSFSPTAHKMKRAFLYKPFNIPFGSYDNYYNLD